MDYKIDYSDASNRQETISVYSLYFYITQSTEYAFDIGHLIISLLIYMVEEGRLNSYAIKVFELKIFINEYLKGISYEQQYNLDEIVDNLITKLQGAKANGEPIKFKYYDSEMKNTRTIKVSYIDFDVKNEGFKITDKGLEFLISSKEIPQEAKLTVSLYLFKLQLEKKKYKAALNTIKSINLETIRQLDVKNEVLAVNRYSHSEAGKLYKKYWGDYFDIRSEETSHYEDAKERLRLFKEVEYLEKNNIKLTPEEIEILKLIDIELNNSSNLQAIYTKEISKMPSEILEIDKNAMINIFLRLFNLKEHFDNLTKLDTQIDAFIYSIQPLLLCKRNKQFGLSLAFASQKVRKQQEDVEQQLIDMKREKHIDISNVYDERMKNNYFKLFEVLIEYLIAINPQIDNIQDFIEYVESKKGEDSLKSIDFLSFLLGLSFLPDVAKENNFGEENIQTITLNKKKQLIHKTIETFQIQELLTFFWFEKLGMNYNAEILITTDPKSKVFIKGDSNRNIGNIKIKLVKKGGIDND